MERLHASENIGSQPVERGGAGAGNGVGAQLGPVYHDVNAQTTVTRATHERRQCSVPGRRKGNPEAIGEHASPHDRGRACDETRRAASHPDDIEGMIGFGILGYRRHDTNASTLLHAGGDLDRVPLGAAGCR